MPILVFISMVIILLNMANSMFIQDKIEYEIVKSKFNEEQYSQKIIDIDENLLNYYSNNYGLIHGDYETSNFIKVMSNFDGAQDEFYLFNNEKICIYKLPEISEDEFSLEDEVLSSRILNAQEAGQKINFNKDITCSPIEEMYNIVSGLTDDDKNIVDKIKMVIGDDFYARIDIETIKSMSYLNLPILNIYTYEITKRHKPIIGTERRIKTDAIVSNKIEESKKLLDDVANLLVEYGKRKFKGFAKLKTYNGVNAFSSLGEGYSREAPDGSDIRGSINSSNASGLQTTNAMMIPTYNLDSSSQNTIDSMVEDWTDNDSGVKCGFANSAFIFDSSLDWYADNAYYQCIFPSVDNNWFSETKIPKPEGYCSLSDNCGITYTLNEKRKITAIQTYTLNEYLKSDDGFNFDINNRKNPFFPNQKIAENFNFIVSSSDGNRGVDKGLSINIGLRSINRPTGLFNNDTINLFDIINFEENYVINKYYISF